MGLHKGIKKAVQQCWTACTYVYDYRLTVNLLHVSDELEHLVRVTDLVVIPRYNLNLCISITCWKSHCLCSIEQRTKFHSYDIARYDWVCVVTE